MAPSDKPQFLAVLNGLAAIKPGAKLTPEGLDVWWTSFASWSIEDFRAAAAQLAKSSEFMPNPYHFEQLRKAGQMTSGEAWALALDHARNGYDSHGPDDPRLNAAVRAIGGYRAIAMSKTDQTPFLERRFAEHYDAIGEREDIRESVPQIAYDCFGSSIAKLPYDQKRRLT
jgi:hypothetical protein